MRVGFIRPIELTYWWSHIVLVKKKGGNKLRVCVDYRDLNARTFKNHFPLLFISTIVDEVAGKKLYSFMDGYSRYNQVSITHEDWHKTAFTSPWGTFVYIVMPFGLCNALATFQTVMTYVFSELLRKLMVVFIDDFSTQTSWEEHLKMLRACFQKCKEVGISLNPKKVYLAMVWGILLGYVVSKKGKKPDLNKVEVIINLQPPTSNHSQTNPKGSRPHWMVSRFNWRLFYPCYTFDQPHQKGSQVWMDLGMSRWVECLERKTHLFPLLIITRLE